MKNKNVWREKSGAERQVVYKLGNKIRTYVVESHDNNENEHVARLVVVLQTQHIVMESSMTGAFGLNFILRLGLISPVDSLLKGFSW